MRAGITIGLAFAFISVRGETLDRIAVTVDRAVITSSDLVRELRVDAFLDRKPVDLSAGARRTAASRLVDQALMLAEAADSHLTLASEDDATNLLGPVKMQFASDQEYRAALAQYHITEADLTAHLLDGVHALRFADLRFRPEIQVSDSDLRAYYDKLAAGWRQSDPAHVPSFEESREQVEKLLTGDREMQALDQWLEMARQQHHIESREAAFQ